MSYSIKYWRWLAKKTKKRKTTKGKRCVMAQSIDSVQIKSYTSTMWNLHFKIINEKNFFYRNKITYITYIYLYNLYTINVFQSVYYSAHIDIGIKFASMKVNNILLGVCYLFLLRTIIVILWYHVHTWWSIACLDFIFLF